jgi:hypothetical protein
VNEVPTIDGATIAYPERFAGKRPVRQVVGAGSGTWWIRLENGDLAVAVLNGDVHTAPVPEAPISAPLPDRPPNPDRITCALDLGMFDGPEVDEALGVATPDDHVVDGWEAGAIVPTHSEIRRLATLTSRSPEWFYAGSLPKFEGFICGPPFDFVGESREESLEKQIKVLKAKLAEAEARSSQQERP